MVIFNLMTKKEVFNNKAPQITIHRFLKKSFLLLKIYVKIKILLCKNRYCNSVATVDKADYLDNIKNLLIDTRKFEKINLKNDGILNLTVNQEKRVDNIFKQLVGSNSISEETRRSLKPVGTRPSIMYGLCKIQKDIIDNCPSFRSILSTVNIPIYKLAKFLVPILKPLTSNEYTIKGSFVFAEEIVEQDCECFIGSLDVLFINIPLEETIDLCPNALFKITKN